MSADDEEPSIDDHFRELIEAWWREVHILDRQLRNEKEAVLEIYDKKIQEQEEKDKFADTFETFDDWLKILEQGNLERIMAEKEDFLARHLEKKKKIAEELNRKMREMEQNYKNLVEGVMPLANASSEDDLEID